MACRSLSLKKALAFHWEKKNYDKNEQKSDFKSLYRGPTKVWMMLDHFGIRHDSLTRYFNPSIPKEPKTSDPKLQLDTETLECSRKKKLKEKTKSYYFLLHISDGSNRLFQSRDWCKKCYWPKQKLNNKNLKISPTHELVIMTFRVS